MMKKRSVLFVTSEAVPFAKVGGLADVAGTLPGVLAENGIDARVIMPFYRRVKERYADKSKFLGWSMIKLGWRSQYSGIYSFVHGKVVYYFIDNEYFFGHEKIYVDYNFDIERFCFFQRAVLEAIVSKLGFSPEIIHCNDWQSAMIPCLLKAHYQASGYLAGVRTVLTIHNLKYQGVHSKELIEDLMDLPVEYVNNEGILMNGAANFIKAGIVYSDAITTVSPSYAAEILTQEYGEGLDGVLWKYSDKLKGILNGIGYDEYDPSNDEHIIRKYDQGSFAEGKKECRKALRKKLGLRQSASVPVAAMVTRLVDQKGLDIFAGACEEILKIPVQIVILGTGDPYYERLVSDLAKEHSGQFAASVTFDNDLAHMIYAGADIFLMPSLFEPCGLSQMISMRYGTVPVVRETGGLKDTVLPYNEFTGEGTGFAFKNPSSGELACITEYAASVYRDRKDAWEWLIRKGMQQDFSWKKSAEGYKAVYKSITGKVQYTNENHS